VRTLNLTAPDGDIVGKQEQVPSADPVATGLVALISVRLTGEGTGTGEPAGSAAGDLDADFHVLEATPCLQRL